MECAIIWEEYGLMYSMYKEKRLSCFSNINLDYDTIIDINTNYRSRGCFCFNQL